jgi:hypothetical protein
MDFDSTLAAPPRNSFLKVSLSFITSSSVERLIDVSRFFIMNFTTHTLNNL